MARVLASDATFVRTWRSARNGAAAYAEAVQGQSKREDLQGLREKHFREIWDVSQRLFLSEDPVSHSSQPHVRGYPALADLFLLTDPQGVVIMEFTTAGSPPRVNIQFPLAEARVPEPHAFTLPDLPLFRQALDTDKTLCDYVRYGDGHVYQAVVHPMMAGGMLVLGDRVDEQMARQAYEQCGQAEALFLSGKDYVAAYPAEHKMLPSLDLRPGASQMHLGREDWLAVSTPLDRGVISLPDNQVVQKPEKLNHWLVVLKPTRVVDRLALEQIRTVTLLVAAAALLALLISWALSGAVVGPVQRLSASLLQVGRGNLDVRLEPEGPKEIVDAGQAFNQMITGLKKKEIVEKILTRLEELRREADLSDPLVRDQTQFGRYMIVDRVGEGGMATVYKALPADTLDERDRVAIKVLHPHFARQPEFQARFQREYHVLIGLSHPGIVRVLESGELNGRLYMAMEFVKGESLSQRMEREGFTVAEFLSLADQMLGAVGYAHRCGVIHRDLKPDNIMLTTSGLKVMDFGLATVADLTRLTSAGGAMGTPLYIAPEQLSGGEPHPAADQYSLGIVFYEMLTGSPPFNANKLSELLAMQLHQKPEPPSKHRPALPHKIEVVIMKMLAKDPSERYPHLGAVQDALRA